MAQDSMKWNLRPAWKVVIATLAGVVLTGLVLAWPAMGQGELAPDITQVLVTSSKSAFFYSPALPDSGGTIFFNNLSGEGADQIITVTVTVSDVNPLTFSGGYAFGITPTTQISTSYGTTSTWSVAYTVQQSHGSENGIRFVITDSNNLTDTTTISFSRDIEGPGMVLSFAHTPDADSGGDDFAPLEMADEGWEDDLTAGFSWAATTDNSGGSGVAGYQLSSTAPVTSAFHTTTNGSLTASQQGNYTVTIRARDKVGNLGSPPNYVRGIHFDLGVPVNGNLEVEEQSGGEYLYITPTTGITGGTLFYNNQATSSFTVTANTPSSFKWGGTHSMGWKVAFSPGWGEGSKSEVGFPPFIHTYGITSSVEATDVFTVYYVNRAGNVLRIPINAQLDTSGPSFTFTGFTPPNWNNGGVRWYRTDGLSNGWAFTTTVIGEQAGVDPSVGWAYWDHSSGATYDQNQSAAGGDGTFTGVISNTNGTVTVTVVLTDQVNNPNSIGMNFKLDGTPPVVTPTGWAETSGYLHLIGGQLFFSQQMPVGQTATVGGTAADSPAGSGLERATFSDESNLAGSPPDNMSPASWSGAYTFDSGSTQGDGLVVVTVYDHVGNTATRSFTYTLDATPPVVTYTGVTNPGYNPDGDELDEVGNWYAWANFNEGPGNDDWVFFFDFSDSQTGARSARADWDHSVGGNDQLNYNPDLDGSGIFGTGTGSSNGSVQNDADGVVTVTLRIDDNVGNVGFDRLKLRIDNTAPTINAGGSWSESSPFLHANGSTLYFSHQMSDPQQATLSGTAHDGDGSGLNVMTFSSEPNLAGSPGPDNDPGEWSGIYTFSSSSTSSGDGTASVTLTDHLGHTKTQTYTYVLDITPPTAPPNFTITTPPVIPGYYNTRNLGLSWASSSESGSGLLGYYLGTSNPPTNFISPTVTAATLDTGSDGVFTFYLQAKDRVANASLTSTGPITVDTQGPQSVISASPEEAEHRFLVQWGADDLVTWPVNFDVQYRINGGGWVDWLSATTATSQYFGPDVPVTVDNDTVYQFQVRARDYVGNQGGWSAPWSGALTRRFVFLPVLFNNLDTSIPFAVFDGFETGAFVGWKTGGALSRSVVPHPVSPPNGVPPNAGNYAARLGSPSYGCGNQGGIPVGQAFIQAYASVPASGTPSLRFDYRVLSYDSVRDQHGEWWDRLEVQVNGTRLPDENGSSLGNNNPYGDPALGPLNCSSLYDSGWREGKINLSAYAGQTVILTFFNENHKDGYWNTYSYLDNIRIEVVP